jgi:hypothetical protein
MNEFFTTLAPCPGSPDVEKEGSPIMPRVLTCGFIISTCLKGTSKN